MICERCNKKKATVIYRENVNGRVRVLRLCGECTEIFEQAGELEDVSSAVGGFPLLGHVFYESGSILPFCGISKSSAETAGGCRCPRCDSTVDDIVTTGKVGCADCYTVFSRELADMLRTTHGGVGHR